MIQSGTADILGKVAGVKTKIDRLLPDLDGYFRWDFARLFDPFLVGNDLILNERPDGRNDQFLMFLDAVLHEGLLSPPSW